MLTNWGVLTLIEVGSFFMRAKKIEQEIIYDVIYYQEWKTRAEVLIKLNFFTAGLF